MQAKLTKRTVEAVKPDPTRDRFVWDTQTRRFGLKVTPSGQRSFLVQYRMPSGGSTKRYKLGDYGALTVEQARKDAEAILREVAQDRDPSAARMKARGAQTISELGERYLGRVTAMRKVSTAAEYRRLWEKEVVPELGRAQINRVGPSEVEALHHAMRERPYLANRVLALLGAFFGWAEKNKLIEAGTNPARNVEAYPEHERERFLTPEEAQRLAETLTRGLTEGLRPAPRKRPTLKRPETAKHRVKATGQPVPLSPYTVAAIRFLLLTGWRKEEALGLRWEWVDFTREVITLPDTKAGRVSRPVAAPALQLLQTLPRVEGNPFVFAGTKPGAALRDLTRVWYAVRIAAKLDDVRLHDLRHTFGAFGMTAGLSLPLVGALLGHKHAATTKRYAHIGASPLRQAAERVTADIAATFTGPQLVAEDPTPITKRSRAARPPVKPPRVLA